MGKASLLLALSLFLILVDGPAPTEASPVAFPLSRCVSLEQRSLDFFDRVASSRALAATSGDATMTTSIVSIMALAYSAVPAVVSCALL